MVDPILELDLDVPPSPRHCGPGSDLAAVLLDEREEGTRFLRVLRPVRRGEALLVEDPLFLSPCSDDEFHVLISSTCDLATVGAAAAAAGAEYPATASSSSSCAGGAAASATSCPPSASWMGVWEQLTLVVLQAFMEDEEAQNCEDFRNLRGDADRWQEPAGRLWTLLREDVQASLSFEALCEIYSTVMENAYQADEGRLGIFNLGSYAEHSCAPSAFKEVFVPLESSSRPGSPAQGSRGSPPSSPSPGLPLAFANQRPQLVLRAQHDLAEGDAVTLCYVEGYLPTWRRKELLQASYGFDCTCNRCERAPEVVCAFFCPHCSGPCSPTAPLAAPGGDLRGHVLRCEGCGELDLEESYLAALTEAENSEDFTEEVTRLIHAYHHKYFRSYMANIQAMAATERIQAVDSMVESQQRLSGSDAIPLLGKLCELQANAHLDLGDHHQAITTFRRAQEMFAMSHRGHPDAGHDARCYQQETKMTAGPLGAAPRRLSRVPTGLMARSPSLPSLAEGFEEDP